MDTARVLFLFASDEKRCWKNVKLTRDAGVNNDLQFYFHLDDAFTSDDDDSIKSLDLHYWRSDAGAQWLPLDNSTTSTPMWDVLTQATELTGGGDMNALLHVIFVTRERGVDTKNCREHWSGMPFQETETFLKNIENNRHDAFARQQKWSARLRKKLDNCPCKICKARGSVNELRFVFPHFLHVL